MVVWPQGPCQSLLKGLMVSYSLCLFIAINYSIHCYAGAITVDTVQNCACAYKGCHKVDHFKSVFNYDFNETDTPIREEKVLRLYMQ